MGLIRTKEIRSQSNNTISLMELDGYEICQLFRKRLRHQSDSVSIEKNGFESYKFIKTLAKAKGNKQHSWFVHIYKIGTRKREKKHNGKNEQQNNKTRIEINVC